MHSVPLVVLGEPLLNWIAPNTREYTPNPWEK